RPRRASSWTRPHWSWRRWSKSGGRKRKLRPHDWDRCMPFPRTGGRMPSMKSIDALDARILLALDDEPGATILRLAKVLGVSRNTVHARLQRMDRDGLLLGFSQRVPPASLGYD